MGAGPTGTLPEVQCQGVVCVREVQHESRPNGDPARGIMLESSVRQGVQHASRPNGDQARGLMLGSNVYQGFQHASRPHGTLQYILCQT